MAEERDRMEWVQHLGKAAESLARDIRGIIPEESYGHLRASRREFWLAIRSIIDRRITSLEEEGPPTARRLQVQ